MVSTSYRKTYLSVGIVLAAIIVLHLLGWLSFLENLLRRAIFPLVSTSQSFNIKIQDRYAFFRNKEEFFSAYGQCLANVQNNNFNQAQLQLLQEENDQLKKQLRFQDTTAHKLVVSRVIGKEISGTRRAIIIDKGTKDGVLSDLPVIVGEGVLIGKIIKVEERSSLVQLINDSQSKIAVTLLNSDRTIGILEGGYGIIPKLNFISRDEKVVAGNQIITSGLDHAMPRGLFIGIITEVENEPYKPYQQALVEPASDLEKLSLVTVITP